MTTRSTASTAPKASGSEPTLKYVQANGVRFAYLEQGAGPLVMFMHGFPDNAWRSRRNRFWRSYSPHFAPASEMLERLLRREAKYVSTKGALLIRVRLAGVSRREKIA